MLLLLLPLLMFQLLLLLESAVVVFGMVDAMFVAAVDLESVLAQMGYLHLIKALLMSPSSL